MILYITEKCLVSNNGNDKDAYGIREYWYENDCCDPEESIYDFLNNFDFSNVGEVIDAFEGECLESRVIRIEVMDN